MGLTCFENGLTVPQYFYFTLLHYLKCHFGKKALAFKNVYIPEGITEPADNYLWYEFSHANIISPNASKVSYTLYMGVMMCQGGKSGRESVILENAGNFR